MVYSTAMVPVGVLELTRVAESGDLVEGELWKEESEMFSFDSPCAR